LTRDKGLPNFQPDPKSGRFMQQATSSRRVESPEQSKGQNDREEPKIVQSDIANRVHVTKKDGFAPFKAPSHARDTIETFAKFGATRKTSSALETPDRD